MPTTRPARRASATVAVLAAGLLLLAACGSDDSSDSSGGTTATTEAAAGTTVTTSGGGNAETIKFDKMVQQQLKDVGCYSGNVDGILGPQTDAAIVAFQTAEGLTADGEVGPETESALAKATSEKKTVCTSSTPSTTTTTSTTTNANDPVCSATALAKALPSGTVITQFVCSDVYAGVQGQNDYYAVLEWSSSGGQAAWKTIDACGTASAGIPPQVLEEGCKPA